jgi:ribosome-binding protein aMBF1 (putative translation factor)
MIRREVERRPPSRLRKALRFRNIANRLGSSAQDQSRMPDNQAKTLKPAKDAVEILHRRLYQGKPARLKNLEEARANEEIARRIRELRAAAALTQTQLAKVIGTTASVICRLEDADYEGHSLAMLRRIAGALNQRVEIRFAPIRRSA